MIMNKDISKIVQLPLEGGDSLTGQTSLGEAPILKLRLFFKDDEVSDVIVKCKSSKVILNGIKLLNYEKSRKLYYSLARYHRILSFDGSFLREIAFYNKIEKELREVCLMSQKFVKNGELTVAQYVDQVAKEIGKDVKVASMARYEVGEGIEKKEENFAEEVAAQMKK